MNSLSLSQILKILLDVVELLTLCLFILLEVESTFEGLEAADGRS